MAKENKNTECTLNQAMEMGLTEEEFKLICQKIGKIPNILIYGNSGTGKKTILNNFINKIKGESSN